MAEFRMKVVHIPGRTNLADFLTRKRFPTGPDPAPSTGYADPESTLELLSLDGSPSFLHESFTQALASAVDNDSVLGPLAAAERPLAGGLVDSRGHPVPLTTTPLQPSYLWRAGLLFRRSASGDRLCIPSDLEIPSGWYSLNCTRPLWAGILAVRRPWPWPAAWSGGQIWRRTSRLLFARARSEAASG